MRDVIVILDQVPYEADLLNKRIIHFLLGIGLHFQLDHFRVKVRVIFFDQRRGF